jgi:hypothetical protein
MKVSKIPPLTKLAKEKQRARDIRAGYKPTKDNETHRMAGYEDGEGNNKKYYAVPSIRPIDREGNYKEQTIDEAIDRGEVFEFKNKRIAERFAYGSWKKGAAKREAMKAYRSDKRDQRNESK